jgi:hypothetical protein
LQRKEEDCTLREGFHVLEHRDEIYLMQAQVCGISGIAILGPELDNPRQIAGFSDVKPEEHARLASPPGSRGIIIPSNANIGGEQSQ